MNKIINTARVNMQSHHQPEGENQTLGQKPLESSGLKLIRTTTKRTSSLVFAPFLLSVYFKFTEKLKHLWKNTKGLFLFSLKFMDF